ncbi:aspartate kinase [Dysgonomonas sp. PFB1-18]|uniref:aspartate kinase n=1 Tax=unclassified Dysgonomonas TaxID=2630389 RepID=UPI0024757DE3|nr:MULTISPECIES: aspartate kinase [unclassified Dysgonomonas]MDH6310506.1 aspartate kinase [Dysgonomonas sp. PF1-14]MDH6340356.1 aspartate kinase [Dysgonomonas sp. PF1-16]MDH6382064.1 aspartate kinase [Dysgonomonas sp. PFB1-18]MDH6399327.1 aspartate kinase [Dysgonomonas sp. PF1-23]
MKILKFGSASIATADKIKNVATIVEVEHGNIVVLSSMRGTAEALTEVSDYLYKKNQEGATEVINRLEKQYRDLISILYSEDSFRLQAGEMISARFDYIRTFTKDLFTLFEERVVMAQGELVSSELFHLYLLEKKVNAVLVPALDFMRTDKNAAPDPVYIKDKLMAFLNTSPDADLYITQGYICRNAYGEIDDLRKGGSDFTASLVGVAVGADEVQIWADVDAMQNNDPRYVKDTKVIPYLNFDEAAELAYFGTKILHPSSILPAKLANIPVRLKNIEYPDAQGTLISNETEAKAIKAVAARDNITAIKIKSGRMLLAHGFLRRMTEVFENYQTSIDMLATSEIGVSLTIDDDKNLQLIVDDLKKYGTVSVDADMVIVSVIGDLESDDEGFASNILSAVKGVPIRMISYGGSKYNFSFLIEKKDKEKTLQILNDKLFN